jgi:hypothetical protein
MTLLALVGVSQAQQTCLEPVSLMQIGAELGEIRKSLDVKDVVDVRARLDRVTERLPCLDDVLPANAWAEYARYVSVAFFFRQEEDEMLRWQQSSAWADPTLAWGPAFPETHPLRRIAASAGDAAVVTVADRSVAPPKGGGVFVCGRLVETPSAPMDVPVFVQVFDKDRRRVSAFFQNGAGYPETWLGPPDAVVTAPVWWGTGTAPPPKPTRVARTDGGGSFPVVPVVTGVALFAASGVSYVLAGQAAGSMADLSTSPELTSARSRANALVLVSAATLAGGVGVMGGGVLLSGSGFTFRF